MGRESRKGLIDRIEKRRGSKVFCLLTSDRPNIAVQLQKDILPRFVNHLRKGKEYSSIDLFIFTHGGDTLAGFGLSRLLREYSQRVSVLVPDCCHSAGTLIALGCNEIVMTKAATLSPIDPSIIRPLNPAIQAAPNQIPQLIPLSVESVAGFQSLVNDAWKIRSQRNVKEILKILSEKVHPLALGDVYRVRQQTELLARELLLQHRKDSSRITKVVHTLSKGLGSHDYLIYRNEARKILGTQIKVDEELEEMIWDLYLDFVQEMELGVPFDPSLVLGAHPGTASNVPAQPVTRKVTAEVKLAVIEGLSGGDRAVRRMEITEVTIPQPGGGINRQIMPPVDTFAGWESYA